MRTGTVRNVGRRDRVATAHGRRWRSVPEPGGIGTAGAHDTLAAEVHLLGSLLGQIVNEQAGPEIFDLVERVRRRAIALRHDDDPAERHALDADLADLDLGTTEAVITAFALYFQLVNLVEARGRVRALRRRERAARDGILDDSIAEAIAVLRKRGRSDAALDAAVGRPVGLARPDRAPDGGAATDGARRAAPRARCSSNDSTTRA